MQSAAKTATRLSTRRATPFVSPCSDASRAAIACLQNTSCRPIRRSNPRRASPPFSPGSTDTCGSTKPPGNSRARSEEHTSELQSRLHLVCRLLLEKKKKQLPIQAAHVPCLPRAPLDTRHTVGRTRAKHALAALVWIASRQQPGHSPVGDPQHDICQ